MGEYLKYEGYKDSKGRLWRHRRPNGWPNDDKAPDGYTVSGYRLSDAQGRIRFGGSYWAHPDIKPRAMHYVNLNCAWGTEIQVIPVDTATWNPDTMGDDYRAFLEHTHDFMRSVKPENVGDTNKRPVTK